MQPPNVLTLTLFIKGSLTWIRAIHQIWTRHKLQRLAASKNVLESSWIRGFKLQCFFARFEVQQVVSERQIEEFSLPSAQTVFGVKLG
ncbi:hypothetical protein D3C77_563650 [compost metagenome]